MPVLISGAKSGWSQFVFKIKFRMFSVYLTSVHFSVQFTIIKFDMIDNVVRLDKAIFGQNKC